MVWLLFAIPFYQSGLAFTVWILDPQNLRPTQELWALAFPGMLTLFVLLQRYAGCASGQCRAGRAGGAHKKPPAVQAGGDRPFEQRQDCRRKTG